MADEGRKDRVHTLIGRLESIKHSMFWLLKPGPARDDWHAISGEDQAVAVRAKAKGLREIAEELGKLADDIDDLADDIEVPE